eukprot:1294416-Rhodomonas_salina.2
MRPFACPFICALSLAPFRLRPFACTPNSSGVLLLTPVGPRSHSPRCERPADAMSVPDWPYHARRKIAA